MNASENHTQTIVEQLTAELINTRKKDGYYGDFGGMFVPPMLEEKLIQLGETFKKCCDDSAFKEEYLQLLKDYVGRPSPLYFAPRLSELTNNRIYLKREDLNHTGSHKINNTLGQILLAKKMGAKEIIAETGAGQHGVATATAAAMMGLECKIFMGARDIDRQAINVKRIELLGAEVIPVSMGTASLKDAVDAALGYYIEHPDAYFLVGSQVGPYPYPQIVGYFQSVIGQEARKQILEKESRLPDHLFACIGGGSNAIGLFSAFLDDENVKIHAAEGGGDGLPGKTAATLNFGSPMIFQGNYSICLNNNGEAIASYSMASGLDYPGVSPQHANLKTINRVDYVPVTDQEAREAFRILCRTEGIIPAVESAHAVALALASLENEKDKIVIINLSGRGDKDVARDDL